MPVCPSRPELACAFRIVRVVRFFHVLLHEPRNLPEYPTKPHEIQPRVKIRLSCHRARTSRNEVCFRVEFVTRREEGLRLIRAFLTGSFQGSRLVKPRGAVAARHRRSRPKKPLATSASLTLRTRRCRSPGARPPAWPPRRHREAEPARTRDASPPRPSRARAALSACRSLARRPHLRGASSAAPARASPRDRRRRRPPPRRR